MSLLIALGALTPHAQAFCGAYVGGADAELSNRASQIVIARHEDATTLTMFNDYAGDQSEFGLVIPVPSGFDEDNLRLADADLLARLDGYTAPRMVAYTCEDFYTGDGIDPNPNPMGRLVDGDEAEDDGSSSGTSAGASASSSSSGCVSSSSSDVWFEDHDEEYGYADEDGPAWVDTATGVIVETEIELGEYRGWVISSEDAGGLLAWLDENGFVMGGAAAALFDDYIAAGTAFLALRVDLEETSGTRDWLSPLQMGYYSDIWGLPIRAGALSSAGVQDLTLYTITSPEAGRTAISNYDETRNPEDECMLPLGGESFNDAWADRWTEASGIPDDPLLVGEGDGGFAWTTEYSWGSGKCDPCNEGGPLEQDDVYDLGYPDAWWGWHVTRLHLRYTPDAVKQDLSLYSTGLTEQMQIRYIAHEWELESLLPTCDEDPVEPGACYTAEYWARRAEGRVDSEPPYDDSYLVECGCKAPDRAILIAPLLLALGLRRRR